MVENEQSPNLKKRRESGEKTGTVDRAPDWTRNKRTREFSSSWPVAKTSRIRRRKSDKFKILRPERFGKGLTVQGVLHVVEGGKLQEWGVVGP